MVRQELYTAVCSRMPTWRKIRNRGDKKRFERVCQEISAGAHGRARVVGPASLSLKCDEVFLI